MDTLRPSAVLKTFWDTVIGIDEGSEFFEAVYIEVDVWDAV